MKKEIFENNNPSSSYEKIRSCPSPNMRLIADLINRVATKKATIFVQGETGVGKELVARAIHEKSGRTGLFVPVNCGNQNRDIIASELFGHKKGAFSGAVRDHDGFLKSAHNGTLFLDEISELSPEFQSRLLRVLDDKMVNPVGSTQPSHSDFRLITATNNDLTAMVRDGRFRRDLYYRLVVFQIIVEPLRKREADIIYLAKVIASTLSEGMVALSEEAMIKISRHDWPGNVRELKHTLEQAIALTDNCTIRPEHLWTCKDDIANIQKVFASDDRPDRISDTGLHEALTNLHRIVGHKTFKEQMYIWEKFILEEALKKYGNPSRVSRELKTSRANIYNKMRRHGIIS